VTRYVCLLRAINVGGRNITMAELKKSFQKAGLEGVETFIASGNVIFESAKKPQQLEKIISTALEKDLGYAVPSFLRTLPEMEAVVGCKAFDDATLAAAVTYYVGFVGSPLTTEQKKKLYEFRSDIDEFNVTGREIYWACRTRSSDSKFNNAVMERRLGVSATWRGINTVKRLVAKYNDKPGSGKK
jgi:uncharacterized protein (DUF1697 family)